MAIKTFSAGEVLTAGDTNTYLANSGLVFISSTNITAGASTATVSNCFSSTYDRYKILISTSASAGGGTQGFTLTPNVGFTGVYTSGQYQLATSATVTTFNITAGTFIFLGYAGSNQMVAELDNYNGYANEWKTGNIKWSSADSTASYGGFSTTWSTSTARNTGFFVGIGGGLTMGAGTILVYGYRKA